MVSSPDWQGRRRIDGRDGRVGEVVDLDDVIIFVPGHTEFFNRSNIPDITLQQVLLDGVQGNIVWILYREEMKSWSYFVLWSFCMYSNLNLLYTVI